MDAQEARATSVAALRAKLDPEVLERCDKMIDAFHKMIEEVALDGGPAVTHRWKYEYSPYSTLKEYQQQVSLVLRTLRAEGYDAYCVGPDGHGRMEWPDVGRDTWGVAVVW